MSKPDYTKKSSRLSALKSGAARFSLSPLPSKSRAHSIINPISLYHRRNITTLIHSTHKHSSHSSLNFASDSCKGFHPNNPSKSNQDSLIIHPNLDKDTHLFGVCDGHGLYGKEISTYISTSLPSFLKGNPISPKLFIDSISFIDQELKSLAFDSSFSGSTLVCCCILKNRMMIINVGDSRAILGKKGYIKWEFVQLTRDHKPDLPEEAARIRAAGGRIAASNTLGPLRVWMQEKNSPGLAMSRSIGDHVVHQIGVTSEPEINERLLKEDDEFLVIGSDGLFEFLSNQEIVTIVGNNIGTPKLACDELIANARSRWAKVIFK